MPIRSTTYVREDGTEARAQVAQPDKRKRRRSSLRDRIARIELDHIDRDLRDAFDRLGAKFTDDGTVHIGVDLSSKSDISTVWIYKP